MRQVQQNKSSIDLFAPVRLGPYDLRNRMVMAPMTRNRAGVGNVPHQTNAIYYGQPRFDFASLRKAFKGAYIANAGYTRERAYAALACGDADLVSFGALFLANPDLPARFATGAPLNTPDQSTFYGGNEKGYTDYPFVEVQPA